METVFSLISCGSNKQPKVYKASGLSTTPQRLLIFSALIRSNRVVPTSTGVSHPINDLAYFVLFDLILYVRSTIFQFNREGSSWVEPVLS